MVYIKLQNVGITFTIYNTKTRSVRNQIFQAIGGAVKKIDNNIHINALHNINLDINEGDKIGLIGHNGAGKSTLLKVLAGIYEPTQGSIEINGKCTSLTDITMGMDPENSGYENIIMRLVFMGLSFAEARNKVEEIIDFSELHEYIGLPIRTYSTGMYLRLAFAIATSVVPDILIMDEMIGTGDASFVKKARQKSLELVEKTRIMVLSSHDLKILSEICNQGIWMERGKIITYGPIQEVIDAYVASGNC